MMAGVPLGIFEVIEGGEQDAAELADALGLGLHAEILTSLLNVLVGAGFLRKEEGLYRLSALGTDTIGRGGACRLGVG